MNIVSYNCFKKLLTEAQSKALSKLGFNADVFLGEWEDPKYARAMEIKFKDREEVVSRAFVRIRSAENDTTLKDCCEKVTALFKTDAISRGDYNELMEDIDKQRQELVNSGKL